ncbi:MAG: Inhibitor of sigma-G Gin [Clostridia bacterium]|jgi:hypothetical protein|nr:Inhibitor of sigma-G Gin [Clostridia bacterium]
MESLPQRENFASISKEDNLLPKCILCNQVPELGIRDGFLLIGQFVCSKCEQKLLTLSYNDPTYNIMVQKLREIIYGSDRSNHSS